MPDCRRLPPSMRSSEYAQQASCRPGPEITYFARARIARRTPVLLHQLARYVEIRSSLPFCKSCLHSSAESAGDIGTERRLCDCRCVCSQSTPDAMSAQALHSEASGGLDLRLVVSHRTGWTRQVLQGADDPEWQPAPSGRSLSIFRVWSCGLLRCSHGDDPPGLPSRSGP
jgi:hypothetical protein